MWRWSDASSNLLDYIVLNQHVTELTFWMTNQIVRTGRDVEQLSFPWQVSLQLKEIVPVPDVMKRLMPDNYKVSYHL